MGGPKLSPPKAIAKILGLPDSDKARLSDIIFTEDHRTCESLVNSIKDNFNLDISDELVYSVLQYWEQQYKETYAIEGAHELLNSLHDSGHSIHIVSNLWYPFYKKFKELFNEQRGFIKTETLSFLCGIKKPDMRFYERAFTTSMANPDESIMIGDSLDNDIEPCVDLGMKCYWFKSRQTADIFSHKNVISIEKLNEI